jgi:hypothetical protein
LGRKETRIFLQKGLGRQISDLPVGQNQLALRAVRSDITRHSRCTIAHLRMLGSSQSKTRTSLSLVRAAVLEVRLKPEKWVLASALSADES